MTMKLLEGVVEETEDPRVIFLEAENRRLTRELNDARVEAQRAKEDAERALSMLRRQLSPLYRALQAVFGELDAAGIGEESTQIPNPKSQIPTASAKWDEWKSRLGTSCAKVIDALLLQDGMTVTALTIACKMGKRTVYEATSKMGRAGILLNNGGRFSLKQL